MDSVYEINLKGASLSSWADSLIPKDEWRRNERRARIDGTCYVTRYDDKGNILEKEMIPSRKNPLALSIGRKDYVPTY